MKMLSLNCKGKDLVTRPKTKEGRMTRPNPTYGGPQSLFNKSQQRQNHKNKRFSNKVIA